MSRHVYEETTKDGRYRVHIGWDEPLREYFCHIERWEENSSSPEGGSWQAPIWSTLHCVERFYLDEIEQKCSEYGITLPDSILMQVTLEAYF